MAMLLKAPEAERERVNNHIYIYDSLHPLPPIPFTGDKINIFPELLADKCTAVRLSQYIPGPKVLLLFCPLFRFYPLHYLVHHLAITVCFHHGLWDGLEHDVIRSTQNAREVIRTGQDRTSKKLSR